MTSPYLNDLASRLKSMGLDFFLVVSGDGTNQRLVKSRNHPRDTGVVVDLCSWNSSLLMTARISARRRIDSAVGAADGRGRPASQ